MDLTFNTEVQRFKHKNLKWGASRLSASLTSSITVGGRSTGVVRTLGQAPKGTGEGEQAVRKAVSGLTLDKMILKEAARGNFERYAEIAPRANEVILPYVVDGNE